jgi:diguanylate cyclase (GGDEF)-like protein/PAS domain S-box-containing protein
MDKEALQELQEVNEELKILIEKRTAELSESSEHLRRERLERQQLEDALKVLKQKDMLLEENINGAFFSLDFEGHIISISSAIERLSGYKAGEMLGKHYRGFVHHDDLDVLMASFERSFSGQKEQFEFRIFQNDGSFLYLRGCTWLAEKNGQKMLDGWLYDITDLKKAEENLQWFVEKYRYLLKINPREMALLKEMSELLNDCPNMDEAYEICTRFMQEFFPFTSGALCLINGQTGLVEALKVWGDPNYTKREFSPDDCWSLRRKQLNMVDDPHLGLLCGHVTDPRTGYLCTPLIANKKVLGLLYMQEEPDDNKARKYFNEHQQQLALAVADHLALGLSNLKLRESSHQKSIRDLLTGLFSQCYMEETLERELCHAKRKDTSLGVLMFEMGDFNSFNETVGKDAGDDILRQLAALLIKNTRGGDIVCRYGDEMFVVVLIDANLENTLKRAQQLHGAVKETQVRNHDHPGEQIQFSVGVATFPEHGSSAGEILRSAAIALDQAKTEGRDRVVVAPR